MQELQSFVDVVRGTVTLTPAVEETVHVMLAAFALEKALAEGKAVTLDAP